MSKNHDPLFEKLWYPSRLNVYHAISITFSVATLVVIVAFTMWPT